MNEYFDVIIVGTGAAGLYCALHLPAQKRILILSKKNADESDSFLAQGGICMLRGEDDYSAYFHDTMQAGHYENNPLAVEVMIRSSNFIIRDLLQRGVCFEREKDGSLAFTREGAHSRPRILFHEDVTGREITQTLLQAAQAMPNLEIRENTTMVDLITADNICSGIVAVSPEGTPYAVSAGHVVLACGGLGGLYQNSTNFPHITGDALAIALRRGIATEHIDYVQIHPTTLFSRKPGRRFLISESVRGEGALLYGKNGERFTDELQPRDLLTQAIHNQMQKDGTEFVWEDMRPLGKDTILAHFPNIYRHCLEEGYDCLKEAIPVVPAQHYFMGGIRVDLAGRTSMKRLYACGETCCNGVHGRNRLASNSLLESLVFAGRAADDILFGTVPEKHPAILPDLSLYEDYETLLSQYRTEVLNQIERTEQAS